MLTSKNFARICKLPIVLRDVPPEYVEWVNHDELNLNQVKYFYLMIKSGHADYCILRVTSLLYDDETNVVKARHVLEIASKAKVESADYFLVMLDAFTAGGKNVETSISNFTKFFQARKLSAFHRHMIGWGTPFWNHVRPLFWSRCMPDGLILKTLCPSKGTCKGDGRMPGYNSISPITNIHKLKCVSFVALTVSFVASEGNSVSGQFSMIIKLV